MKTLLSFSGNLLKSLSIILIFVAATAGSNTANAQLRITNLSREEGTNFEAGALFRARSVFTNIDALIRIDSLVNGAVISELDMDNTGYVDAFQPRIRSRNSGNAYAVFTIQLVHSNTTTATFMNSLTVTKIDLDGTSSIKEFCEINLGGGTATFMNNNPEISVSRLHNNAFYGENIRGVTYNDIDTSADAVMFKVTNRNITRFSLRLGAHSNSGFDRWYSVYMRDFEISNSISLPLTLLNFNAILKDNNKVNLNWTTTDHKEFSHFVLQRSTDGKNYKDVMTLFTESVATSSVNQYSYADNITGIGSGVVYYRLQMVDVDTKYQYSPIRMVRLNTNNMVQIQTFPNPVTSELRVTIPSNWQEKATTYEIYNSNGMLVGRTQVARAAQVQQLNVQSLGSGNYIIRVTNGQEMSSSKFVKY